MRIVLAALAVTCALSLSSCKSVATIADSKDLVCSAAQAWLGADPSTRKKVTVELSSAILQAEGTENSDGSATVKQVIGAAKKLISGDGRQVTDAAGKINKYC